MFCHNLRYPVIVSTYRRIRENSKTAEEVLVDLRRYAADDRFSFVDRTGTVSEEIQQGVYKETGATPIYLSSSERTTNADMYIKLVQRGSPAEEAGLKRGMRVLRINGEERIDYQTDQANSFRNFQKFFSDEPLELVVQEPGSERARTITVTGSSYPAKPYLECPSPYAWQQESRLYSVHKLCQCVEFGR